MNPGLVIKLRPVGPWRSGPDSGARNQVDPVYHSDSLYSAVTLAMSNLGLLDEWLSATARNPAGPVLRFSSSFPFHEDLGFIIPPRTVWPPVTGALQVSSKVRWKSARFIPLGLVSALRAGQVPDQDHWTVDGPSECLLPAGRPGPFRPSIRSGGAVDRRSGSIERYTTACTEFLPGAGLWFVVSFADEQQQARWSDPVRAAFRLLADSGFGGERSHGWGHSETPEFIEGALPDMILPPPSPRAEADAAPQGEVGARPHGDGDTNPEPEVSKGPGAPAGTAHWLLSLFSPAPEDAVDWKRGNYSVVQRGGRVESPTRSGDLKKFVNMVTEGSVLIGSESLRGAAPDVAPDGFPHPVYRAGFALAIPLPGQVTA